MPWLVKENADLSENLFFVHVPRCGGTSLMHHFDVPKKVMKGRSCWGMFGMKIFFQRYKLLESANFPYKTWSNAFSALLFGVGVYVLTIGDYVGSGIVIMTVSVLSVVCMTFVFTAPTMVGSLSFGDPI